jgi:hypothetical protein
LNEQALLPLIDDMLFCRHLYAQKVNDMFGTDISVTFDSAWDDTEEKAGDNIEIDTGD